VDLITGVMFDDYLKLGDPVCYLNQP